MEMKSERTTMIHRLACSPFTADSKLKTELVGSSNSGRYACSVFVVLAILSPSMSTN